MLTNDHTDQSDCPTALPPVCLTIPGTELLLRVGYYKEERDRTGKRTRQSHWSFHVHRHLPGCSPFDDVRDISVCLTVVHPQTLFEHPLTGGDYRIGEAITCCPFIDVHDMFSFTLTHYTANETWCVEGDHRDGILATIPAPLGTILWDMLVVLRDVYRGKGTDKAKKAWEGIKSLAANTD